MQVQTTPEDHRIAWLTALAISIHLLESAFPSPLPGFKPGLANVITIVVLIQFGWRTAAWVSRLGSRLPGEGFGPVGYSVLAALAHMTGQFTIAWLLFIPHPALWQLFPVLLTAALLFGCVSGIIARAMCQRQLLCRT